MNSFRQGVIGGEDYIFANGAGHDGFIASRPLKGGAWQKITAPGPTSSDLSLVTTAGKTELMNCIGGNVFYGMIDSPTKITWQGPMKFSDETRKDWTFTKDDSAMSGMCPMPTQCNPDVHDLGVFDTELECRAKVNETWAQNNSMVSSWTYQHKVGQLGLYAGHCYVLEASAGWALNTQQFVDSGRAPGTFVGGVIDCTTAWVDPNDRNHFLFAQDGHFKVYESKDGGESIKAFETQPLGGQPAYFVAIDRKGLLYTAGMNGAFVSKDQGLSWHPFHAVMNVRPSDNVTQRVIDRVQHDYQNILPEFRDDDVAFPSDQGLHIVDRSSDNYTFTSAVGDLHNTMSLSVLISPSKDGKSRNLVTNIWDWAPVASWNDGATWASWAKDEKGPEDCNEGGYGRGLGASAHQLMFHNQNWWASADGGHNFVVGNLPGSVNGDFDYIRATGSRHMPSGTYFALMDAPSVLPSPAADRLGASWTSSQAVAIAEDQQRTYDPRAAADDGDDEDEEEKKSSAEEPRDNVKWLITSRHFGLNFSFTKMPANLQGHGLYVDPTSATSLYTVTPNCLAHSTTFGKTWSPCMKLPSSAAGKLSSLVVKDSKTMFLCVQGAPPLRTQDGGQSWTTLSSPKLARLYKYGATFDASLSWTGKTLVLHGVDLSAVDRRERATIVWKTVDDGETWSDETGDIVTISPGAGVWYEKDFYFVTRGEGVCVKRDFGA